MTHVQSRCRLRTGGIARTFAVLAGAAVLCGLPASLSAQPVLKDFPNKRIRIIVPFAAGGPPDFSARVLSQKLTTSWGQPVVVENRGGAGAVLGSELVAKSPPDGYTWLITTGSHTSNSAFNQNVPYDPVRDFTPVTQLVRSFGQVLIVHPTVPAKTVQELIALARRQPGKHRQYNVHRARTDEVDDQCQHCRHSVQGGRVVGQRSDRWLRRPVFLPDAGSFSADSGRAGACNRHDWNRTPGGVARRADPAGVRPEGLRPDRLARHVPACWSFAGYRFPHL
ncbi:MAG: hypothetical protein HYU75_07020 [Betaproteobacteria bacterium]|nr:hypothetical protein [Betaproteobacteria bacterium]